MKEIDIQNKLWGNVLQEQGLQKRVDSARTGWMPEITTLPDVPEAGITMLGDFAPRVLGLSLPGNPQSLIPEQLAIAGGWCALRTSDVRALSAGELMNPRTRTSEKIESVEQVADWIRGAVAFDQIVESIGAIPAKEYVSISERRLWSERIAQKLGVVFDRQLTKKERDEIEQAVEDAEKIRFEMTRRYLVGVLKNEDLSLSRVVDDDIWEELGRARDRILLSAGLNITEMKRGKNSQGIDGRSRVWAMYTQPYFDVLRDGGYLSTKTVFVAEPVQHAAVESLADKEIADRFFRKRNGIFFNPSGVNRDTGFVAFIECINERKQKTKEDLFIGDVPNISNWQEWFNNGKPFDIYQNETLNPAENKLFLWGLNLLPTFGPMRDALLALVEIQQRFKDEKEKLRKQYPLAADPVARFDMTAKTQLLKIDLIQEVLKQNSEIQFYLKLLFGDLTRNIPGS